MMRQDVSDVKRVIKRIEECVNLKNYIIISRMDDKNPKDFMISLGMNVNDIADILLELTEKDYLDTIIDENIKLGYLSVFLKEIQKKIAYIKIGFKDNGKMLVISFHEAKFDEYNNRTYK